MGRFLIGATALVAFAAASVALTGAASAQATGAKSTPKNWNYEIKDGKRVPKGKRQENADGSWREEIRVGKCVTIKEKSAKGEYRETRRCD